MLWSMSGDMLVAWVAWVACLVRTGDVFSVPHERGGECLVWFGLKFTHVFVQMGIAQNPAKELRFTFFSYPARS